MLTKKTRRGCLATTSALAILLGAGQVAAQADPAGSQGEDDFLVQKNSEVCGFSFFTDEDDSLDFNDNGSEACFDMMGGDDVLILNRSDFADGVVVFTGQGRDTSWLTNGNDKITDEGGNDREIRTFDGDDHIVVNLPADRDAFRGVEKAEVTDIIPGPGKNMIRIGENIPTNAVARINPNIRLWPEIGAQDDLNITCGRPWIADVIDLQVPNANEGTTVDIDSHGCGLSLESLHGDMTLRQIGGRLVVDTDRSVSKFEKQSGQMKLLGVVEAGTGLFMEVSKSSIQTDFKWEGSGVAMLSLDLEDDKQGGTFDIASSNQVVFERSGSGEASVTLASETGISARYTATSSAANDRISLSAPNTTFLWEWAGALTFPKVLTPSQTVQSWSSIKVPDNPFLSGNLGPVQLYAETMNVPREQLSPIVPVEEILSASELPAALKLEVREAVIPQTSVDLEIDLRAARDTGCFMVVLAGVEGAYSCKDEGVDIEDASDVHGLSLRYEGQELQIDMNADSGFSVKSLNIRM